MLAFSLLLPTVLVVKGVRSGLGVGFTALPAHVRTAVSQCRVQCVGLPGVDCRQRAESLKDAGFLPEVGREDQELLSFLSSLLWPGSLD